jgi:hypothetical protein
MNKNRTFISLLICGAASSGSFAHHAFVEFDRSSVIEIDGELTDILWRNPHVRFSVRQTSADGTIDIWAVEGPSMSILSRIGVGPANFHEGQQIRVAGSPERSGASRMHVSNALVDGQEYVLGSRGAPRWADTAVGTSHSLLAGGTLSDDATIFRVWSTDGDDPHSNTPGFWPGDYPLTDAARIAQTQWVPIKGSECEPKGMPTIVEQPYPIQFLQEGENIVLRMEEYDTVRTIHMGEAEAAPPRTLLGYSRGYWEDTTLVVETTAIDWSYFDKEGIPQGDAMSVMESFTPSEDGSRLEYTMTVTDAEVFTEPVMLERHWVWRPGEVVKAYDCTWSD